MSWKDRVQISLGDIAESDAEAIVNAANNELWMGAGVAGALKKAGGAVIEQEAISQGPVAVGESVLTSAGTLPALYVIHAAAMSPGRPASREGVRAATASALRLAAEKRIDSIAFPALGTGVGALSLTNCAEEMLAAVQRHCLNREHPGEIRFVLYGQNAQQAFEKVFAALEP